MTKKKHTCIVKTKKKKKAYTYITKKSDEIRKKLMKILIENVEHLFKMATMKDEFVDETID